MMSRVRQFPRLCHWSLTHDACKVTKKKKHSRLASATCHHHHHRHYVFVCSSICQLIKKWHSQTGLTTVKLKHSFPLSARVSKDYTSTGNNTSQTHRTGCQSRATVRFTQEHWVNVWYSCLICLSGKLPAAFVLSLVYTVRPTNAYFQLLFFFFPEGYSNLEKVPLLPLNDCSQEWTLLFCRILTHRDSKTGWVSFHDKSVLGAGLCNSVFFNGQELNMLRRYFLINSPGRVQEGVCVSDDEGAGNKVIKEGRWKGLWIQIHMHACIQCMALEE